MAQHKIRKWQKNRGILINKGSLLPAKEFNSNSFANIVQRKRKVHNKKSKQEMKNFQRIYVGL